MLEWWNDAFVGTELERRFFAEAEATLPNVGGRGTLDGVYDGVAHQRMRLKVNQQLAEWFGLT